MSDLSNVEKRQLERLFQMGGGYVLDFSNRTFDEFVFDSVGKEISCEKYVLSSGSKANRLRAFWKVEPNYVVGKLLQDLTDYVSSEIQIQDPVLFENCRRTAKRLLASTPVQAIDAVVPNSPEREFEVLAKAVRTAIDNNEPEAGLDRLHTFVVKYMRVVCGRHGIATSREKPLHSLMGEYLKSLSQQGMIESQMTERILKSGISLLEAFNLVRNEQSLAHDNRVLNYEESVLIFNHVTSIIRFIDGLERSIVKSTQPPGVDPEDIPF